jgi:hypothetical protein
VQSSSPPHAGLVYTLLITAGLVAAVVGAATVGWIGYRYASDINVREGDLLYEGPARTHGSLPGWIISI